MQDVVKIGGVISRILSIALVVFAVAMAYFGARWQLGDMVARLTTTTDENATLLADAAVRFATSDPNASAL